MIQRDVLDAVVGLLEGRTHEYAQEPVRWINEKLREWVTADQERIVQSVLTHRYTAVPSCHDVGKSYIAGRLAAWWIDSHPLGEAVVVTTAPTAHQVGAILWKEIATAFRRGKLPGYVTGNNEWKIEHPRGPAQRVGIGRKPSDYEPTAFQGIHERWVLVILDEACGVPKALFGAADSLATNENARVLAIGNPDDPGAFFSEVCKPGSGWNVVSIDALRSPNMTKEEVSKYPELQRLMIREGIPPSTEHIPEELRDMLVSAQWVSERIKRWKSGSPMFQSKVRGRFPSVSVDTLIHPHWVELAKNREALPVPHNAAIGVDVARYGTDQTSIVLRQGGHCRVVVQIPSGPVTEVAGQVQLVGGGLDPTPAPVAFVDDVGVGGGVTDILEADGYPALPIIGGAACHQKLPNGKPRFVNLRSELWWNVREALAGPSGTGDDGWIDIDPDDEDLHAQLTIMKYGVNKHGQIWVETKDSLAQRGYDSPDRGDALCYALAPMQPERYTRRSDTARMVTGDLLNRAL